jgi:hypothetical protein
MSTGEAEFISQTIDKAAGPGVYVRESGRGRARSGRPAKDQWRSADIGHLGSCRLARWLGRPVL